MSNSIDTYIVSEIFLFFISRYRKNLSGIFQMIPLPKVQPPPDHRLLKCFYIPQLIYAIIIAGVNIPSDSR